MMKPTILAPPLLFLAALGGCVSTGQGDARRGEQTASYTVRPGDTLSAIAARYRVDMRQLAQRNRLAPPYVIRVGQRLAIPGASGAAQFESRPVVQPLPRSSPADRAYRPQPSTPSYSAGGGASLAGAPRLVWPVDGQVSGTGTLAFAAHEGAAVRSAAAGTVRLQGGSALVVEHGNGWVTSYSGIGRLVVSDGEQVRSGERLGFVGPGESGSLPRLSFELRRGGSAVDPLPLLPPRL